MKTIKIAEHEANVLTKKELLALGFEEIDGTMRKEYPTGAQFGREVGLIIFHEVKGNPGAYEAGGRYLTLYWYRLSWDADEFLASVEKAVSEYRSDMERLGIKDDPKAVEGAGK